MCDCNRRDCGAAFAALIRTSNLNAPEDRENDNIYNISSGKLLVREVQNREVFPFFLLYFLFPAYIFFI